MKKNQLFFTSKVSNIIIIMAMVALAGALLLGIFKSQTHNHDDLVIVPISLDYPTYESTAQLAQDADVIIVGTVLDDGISISGVSQGKTADGLDAPGIPTTEFTVSISKVIKGSIDSKESLTVVLTGGIEGKKKYVAENMPWLAKQSKVLMYLSAGDDNKYYPLAGGAAIASPKTKGSQVYTLSESASSSGKKLEITE